MPDLETLYYHPHKENVTYEALKGGLQLGYESGIAGLLWGLGTQIGKQHGQPASINTHSTGRLGLVCATIGCAIGAIVSGIQAKTTNDERDRNSQFTKQLEMERLPSGTTSVLSRKM